MSEKIGDKNRYHNKIIIFIFIIAMFFTFISFAISDVQVKLIKENENEYLCFELNHNLTNTDYKYYGYGYNVTVYDNYGKEIGSDFITNAEFQPIQNGSKETVKISIDTIYGIIGVKNKYYYRDGCKIWLNGRLGIKANGTLTFLYDSLDGNPETGIANLETGYANATTGETDKSGTIPLNKNGKGIRNGIENEYGVSWSWITANINLSQHFGINYTLEPVNAFDGYEVLYKEVATGKTVSSEKELETFGVAREVIEYSETVNGYEYSGSYKIEKVDNKGKPVKDNPFGDVQDGDSAKINLQKTSSVYTITFYYNKIDPSSIGKPVNIDVEYREDNFDGKKLLNSTTTIGGELSRFNFNSEKIDEYTCIGYYVIGQVSEYFHNTNAKFIIGKEDYSTPVDGRLKIIFIYEKTPYVSIPKCSPSVDGDADTVNIQMKKKDFENATDISVNNAVFKIDDFGAGEDKDGKIVEGKHEFSYFDLYIDKYRHSFDNKSKEIIQSFIVPKNIFTQSTTDLNIYTANIDVTYAAFCTCSDGKPDSDGNRGWAMDNGYIRVNINLIENKPPKANYTYYTEKTLENGDIREISKAYIKKETVINNQASDPNGREDIKYIKYNLIDSKGKNYNIKLLALTDGTYFFDSDNVQADNIQFLGAKENGDIKLKFITGETWTVSQYVEDAEGLNDTYINTITPIELNLKPIAILKDSANYRYPLGKELNGKQNRVVEFNSNSSYVCEFLERTGVEINHNRDCCQITPLDGQSFDGIKFENDNINAKAQVTDNVMVVKYIPMNNTKIMFKEYGRYNLCLQVSDTNGNVSEWSDNIITIHEDLPPTITASVNPKYYRNLNKNAVITFNALPKSIDDDLAKIKSIGYKFDSNNDGSFDDETSQTSNLSNKDVNIDGILYKQITLSANKVGKYQFIINVKEDFKQEAIDKYITDKDYKTAIATLTTEIDNTAPIGTLGLNKNNNIDVKVLTTGITGTRQVDVENNSNNLKVWLESKNNVKVGNIELSSLANEIDGLSAENTLTWRKVTLNGYVDDHKFKYAEIEDVTDTGGNPETDPNKPLVGFWYNILPNGIYADGWNGIPVPNLYLGDNLGGIDIKNLKYKDINRTWGNRYPIAITERDYYHLNYTANNVNTSINGYSIWSAPYSDVTFYSAITNEKLNDFDINFDLSISPLKYGEDDMGDAVFLFNVKDKNNYFAYSEKYYKNWVAGNKIAEIVQVKNGVSKILEKFYYTRKKKHGEWEYYETTVSRIRQVGNLLQAYDGSSLVFETNINSVDTGGYLGISAKDGYTSKRVSLNIDSLTYIDNSSIYEAVNSLNWEDETDKYLINLVENNKLDELTDNTQLNKTAGLLQGKEINLINIGVNSVNGTKLKELTTKNQNNGTYIELGSIYDNFNTVATYINNKYTGSTTLGQYLLLGSTINYIENYSDNENDPLFSKEFKYYHLPNYFEYGLGAISNNNIWMDKPIKTFSKTGKYTLNYRVQDNPLFPDFNLFNSFNIYRKYSNIFAKEIYVHRKPISNFNIADFSSNAYKNTLLVEDFEDETYVLEPIFTRYAGNASYQRGIRRTGYLDLYGTNKRDDEDYTYAEFKINVPDNAIAAKIKFNIIDDNEKGYINVKLIGAGINQRYYDSANVEYKLSEGNYSLLFLVPKYNKWSGRPNFLIKNMKLSYSLPNENVSINIIENSYDIDHKNLSNKGIKEWQWKLIDKNGRTVTENSTSKSSGVTWIKNSLNNSKWFNATVLLRVKDLEGVWSEWSSKYIDGEAIKDGWNHKINESIPIANFLIDKNPLLINSESQTITDTSYDTGGSSLNYIWTVRKDNNTLFTSYLNNISSKLNEHILANGIGTYEISLIVRNSSGIYSNFVTKSFEVVIYNDAPTVNFNLVSNENPAWVFPKTLGLFTLKYRPPNTLFFEEHARFDTYVHDSNVDNLGFDYNWKLERFTVKDIDNISGISTNTYSYATQFPFSNNFKLEWFGWGAYRITLKAIDKPPVPPYTSTDAKSATVTKYYYIVPQISLTGSFTKNKTEVAPGDTITLKATTNLLVDYVDCTFAGKTYTLDKTTQNSSNAYWGKDITIPEDIDSGTYNIQFVGKTTYGGNGNVTREIKDNVAIDIVTLKLINFRITNIVNQPYITFPYTKDMLVSNLIPYKTGYNVSFKIDSKGKPDNVYGRIVIGNNQIIDQVILMTKVSTGDTEIWQGRFYTPSLLPINTVISIKTDCKKGTTTYDYNLKENWDGRSLIIKGSALQDGRINLTN